MTSRKFPVHPLLKGHVDCLWYSEHALAPPHQEIDLMPDSFIELVFSFGADAEILHGGRVRSLPKCYLVGLLDAPMRLRGRGRLRSVGARFFAWGFHTLLGGEIRNLVVEMDKPRDEWQELARAMESHVFSDDPGPAIELLHERLIDQALHVEFEEDVIQAAGRRLLDERGRILVQDLADFCQLSPRQLERRFASSLGKSPKAMNRLVRFEHALGRLCRDPKLSLANLAQDCGYIDQAHLSREFKRFSHRTPRQFVGELLATTEYLRSAGVAFIQDV